MKRSALVFLLLIAASLPLAAQPFIAAGGSGVPDELTYGLYEADTNSLKHNATSTGSIAFRYTLNDTTATGAPSWSNIELRAYDPGASSYVRVQIYRHTLGGTYTNGVCTSNDNAMYAITTCTLPAINFNSGDLYSAVVTVNRTSTAVTPIFNGFRLY
jgi:hypothetical protein